MTIIYQIYTDIYHYRNEQLTKSILLFRKILAVVYLVNLEYIWLFNSTLSIYSLQKGKSCGDSRHVKLTNSESVGQLHSQEIVLLLFF
uniref:Uncharacterized protein n=1 Tax=Octopus bimaculoides TaxID=37653 RepID=A0A0L8GCW9_OCTBM